MRQHRSIKCCAPNRRVLKEALRLDLIDSQDYSKAVDVKSIKQSGKPRGRALSPHEIAALMKSCWGNSSVDVTDTALIAILPGGGIRRAEAVNLEKVDFNLSTGALEIREGKGKKDRTVYLLRPAHALVKKWLNLRGEEPGPLLFPIRKGGEIQFRRMTHDGVLKILQRRAFLAGVDSFSPHDLGRTFGERPPRCWSRYRDSAEVGRSRFRRDDSVRLIAGAKKRSDGPCCT